MSYDFGWALCWDDAMTGLMITNACGWLGFLLTACCLSRPGGPRDDEEVAFGIGQVMDVGDH